SAFRVYGMDISDVDLWDFVLITHSMIDKLMDWFRKKSRLWDSFYLFNEANDDK
ncbi:14654_t:CDS:2, partial [Entrophospora sp. SA101]